MYWSAAQIVAHHSSNGCNLQPGDLIGTGTLSTDSDGGLGSLLEISRGGKQPVDLPSGETRSFLEDGDEVTLRAWCEREGAVRIGFGECVGTRGRQLGPVCPPLAGSPQGRRSSECSTAERRSSLRPNWAWRAPARSGREGRWRRSREWRFPGCLP